MPLNLACCCAEVEARVGPGSAWQLLLLVAAAPSMPCKLANGAQVRSLRDLQGARKLFSLRRLNVSSWQCARLFSYQARTHLHLLRGGACCSQTRAQISHEMVERIVVLALALSSVQQVCAERPHRCLNGKPRSRGDHCVAFKDIISLSTVVTAHFKVAHARHEQARRLKTSDRPASTSDAVSTLRNSKLVSEPQLYF